MGRASRIGFSRVLGPWGLAVLGVAIAVAMSWISADGVLLVASGTDTPLVVGIGALLLLPVVLGLVSRASESDGGGTLYSIVRQDGRSAPLFLTGWLCVGGYLCVAALVIDAVARRVGLRLEPHLGRHVPALAVIAPTAALAVLSQVISPVEHLRARLILAGAAVLATLALVAAVAIGMGAGPGTAAAPSTAGHYLTAAALLGGALWSVDVALDYRRMYRRDDRSLALSIASAWLAAAVVAAVIAAAVVARPALMSRLLGAGGGVWERDDIGTVALAVSLALCWIVVSKALSRLQRLTSAMARDGSIPALFDAGDDPDRAPFAFLILFGTLAGTLALVASPAALAGVAAVTFLWAGGIAFLSQLRPSRERGTPGFELPLHPLFPVVALVVCGFLSLIVPFHAPAYTLGWVVAGLGVRLLYRRGAKELGAAPEIEEADGEHVPIPDEESIYRVLVCIGPAGDTKSLIRLGHDIARARGGDVVVLRVVALLERLPRSEVQTIARRQWRALRNTVRDLLEDATHAYPLVRIATSEIDGIVDAAAAHQADLVLLDAPRPRARGAAEHEAMIDGVLGAVQCAAALVAGDVPADVRRVVAAVSTGPDTPSVLSVAESLAKARSGALVALSVTNQRRTAEDAERDVATLLGEVGVEAKVATTEDEDPARGIARYAGANDVVVMGTTRDRALTHAGTTGLWVDVVDRAPGCAVLVRRAEKRSVAWFRDVWDTAYSTLPTLTVGERAEVYSQMRHAARAGIDFYVLIVISSALAIFGLFQDSAAVVIGAMLVAPLMSPIVAISQGIVQGNVTMIRRGLASTMKGTIVAILVAATFTLAMPDAPPTVQIMARTEPSLLDLGVGLAAGAAAAYGISRKSVKSALPGVAIAVALVPPLCVVGYGLGADRLDISFGATLLFLTNLAAIVFVATVLFLLLGFYPRQSDRRRAVRGAILATLTGLALVSVPLALSSWETSRAGRLEVVAAESIRHEADALGLQLDDLAVERRSGEYVVRATVYAPRDFPEDGILALRDHVEAVTGEEARLEIRLVRAEYVVTDREER